MALQEVSDSVVDASHLFFQERQSGEIDHLYDTIYSQETYNRSTLMNIIERVNNIDVKELPKDAQIKFQSLCGRVHTLNVNHMVDAIYDEAQALSRGEYQSSEEMAKRTQTLKEMMADVWANHSLSPENSRFLQIASVKLKELTAQETPSSKIDDMVHPCHVNFIEEEDMLPESEVIGAMVSPEWEEAELSMDIIQTAQLLHEKNPGAEVKFRQLPMNVQERLGPIEDSPEYIQEMVAYGMNLVRKDGYTPSIKEIEIMFAEAPKEE